MNHLVNDWNHSISERDKTKNATIQRVATSKPASTTTFSNDGFVDKVDRRIKHKREDSSSTGCSQPSIALRSCQTGDIISISRGSGRDVDDKKPIRRIGVSSDPVSYEDRNTTDNIYTITKATQQASDMVAGKVKDENFDQLWRSQELTSMMSECSSYFQDQLCMQDGDSIDSFGACSYSIASPSNSPTPHVRKDANYDKVNRPSLASSQQQEKTNGGGQIKQQKKVENMPRTRALIVNERPNKVPTPPSPTNISRPPNQDDNSTIDSYDSIVQPCKPCKKIPIKSSLVSTMIVGANNDVENQVITRNSHIGGGEDRQFNNTVIIEYPEDFMSHRINRRTMMVSPGKKEQQQQQQLAPQTLQHPMRRPESPKYEERTRHDEIFCFGRYGRFVFILSVVGLIAVLILTKQHQNSTMTTETP